MRIFLKQRYDLEGGHLRRRPIVTLKTWLELPEETEHYPLQYLAIAVEQVQASNSYVLLAGLKYQAPSMTWYFLYRKNHFPGNSSLLLIDCIMSDDTGDPGSSSLSKMASNQISN